MRAYILHVVGITFAKIPQRQLGEMLRLDGAALDALVRSLRTRPRLAAVRQRPQSRSPYLRRYQHDVCCSLLLPLAQCFFNDPVGISYSVPGLFTASCYCLQALCHWLQVRQ